MAERSAIGIAVATCLLTANGIYAQGMAPAAGPMVAPNPYYAPAPNGPPPGGPMTGFSTTPDGCPGSASGQPGCYLGADGMTTKADLGQTEELDHTPFEEAICRALRNVYVRLDYLNWGISRPNTTLIGAQPAPGVLQPDFDPFFESVNFDVTRPFPVTGGTARGFNTSPVSLGNTSGIQGTLSLPMTYGSAELTGFILQRHTQSIEQGIIPGGVVGNTLFAAIPLTSGGAPSDNLLLFSDGFAAQFSSLVFGAEGNIVFNPFVPKERGFIVSPLIGYRYLGVQERFDVVGINPGPVFTTIQSRTISNIHGPQIGGRIEWVSQWFTIGAEPKVMLGVNQFAAEVTSSDPTIGGASSEVTRVRFAPVGALNVYAKIPVHDQIKLYVAYNLLAVSGVSRPQDQIAFDETAGGDNNIHAAPSRDGLVIQGYSVGGEVNF